jgi:hypothetical protein
LSFLFPTVSCYVTQTGLALAIYCLSLPWSGITGTYTSSSSVSKLLLSAHCVPGITLGLEDKMVRMINESLPSMVKNYWASKH